MLLYSIPVKFLQNVILSRVLLLCELSYIPSWWSKNKTLSHPLHPKQEHFKIFGEAHSRRKSDGIHQYIYHTIYIYCFQIVNPTVYLNKTSKIVFE